MRKTPTERFTTPTISPNNPTPRDMAKDWIVWFRFLHDGKWKMFSFKKGINYQKRFKDRLAEANALRQTLLEELRIGWNPVTNQYVESTPVDHVSDLAAMPFAEALTFALKQCAVSETTRKNYRSLKKRISNASMAVLVPRGDEMIKQDFSIIPIREIRRKHIRLLLDQCRRDYGWSNKAYNKNLGYFKSIMSRLVEYEVIESNPSHRIPTLPTVETQKFLPYTDDEKKRIREHLFQNHFGFFIYLMIIYHTGIRPKEVLALKIRDLDVEAGTITIKPDLELENSKTKKIRKVPIIPSLMAMICQWIDQRPNPENYIFGSPYTTGRGNSGSAKGKIFGSMHPEYFKPSKTHIKRDTVTKLWKRVVIDDLGINKHLYAAKHTGADAKILAGIDLDALRELYGHSSKQMTEKYISELKEIHRKQIMALSPEF